MNMKKYWYRRSLIILLTAVCIVGGGYSVERLVYERARQEVSAKTASGDMVIPGGMPVGIYMETDGVMVLGTDKITSVDGQDYEPAHNMVKKGDYIVGLNDASITSKKDLVSEVSSLTGDEVILHLRRNGDYLDVKMKPVQYSVREYKLGIWVRDNAQGLGTVTFLTGESKFGALGHGIHDTDTNELLQISGGSLYKTSISNIQKGEKGVPGGMEGIIVYNTYNVLGNISKNTNAGIYGSLERIDSLFTDQTPMETAAKNEIKEGAATIRCTIDGIMSDYDIRITKIDLSGQEVNKGIVIEVTDPELLKLTGGIVQGMSGSPIIQNDRLIGAVTHVFVQDATKGYGIFIENMLENVD